VKPPPRYMQAVRNRAEERTTREKQNDIKLKSDDQKHFVDNFSGFLSKKPEKVVSLQPELKSIDDRHNKKYNK
jgi:hypothetical protein